jgi:DNA-binding CsgD family transcriptional regulator/PAS domain-containing protein
MWRGPGQPERAVERLKQRDLRTVLEFLREIYAVQDLDAFAAHLVSALPQVVRSHITSYNEVNARKRRIAWVDHPPNILSYESRKEVFEALMANHPLIAYYQRTHDGQALKISDFLSSMQFNRLRLYNEFYRPLNVAHQMAFTLPAPPPMILGIALNRDRPDFSERDRLLLNLLRPHLIQAYRNAEAVTRMHQEAAAARQVLERLNQGVVILTGDGWVRGMNPQARAWMVEYFGVPARRADRLPETLAQWVRQQEAALAATDVPAPQRPLVVERQETQLVVRLLLDAGHRLLLLEERLTGVDPRNLESLGLSRREAEVLAWVAEGKTNAEIGAILGARPRTVGKHLERIYQKLGVETRTAAANRALTLLSATPS